MAIYLNLCFLLILSAVAAPDGLGRQTAGTVQARGTGPAGPPATAATGAQTGGPAVRARGLGDLVPWKPGATQGQKKPSGAAKGWYCEGQPAPDGME